MQKDNQESSINIDDYSYYSSSNEEINEKNSSISNSKKLLITIFIGSLLGGYIFMDNQNKESSENEIKQKHVNIEESTQLKIREEIPTKDKVVIKEAGISQDDLEKIANDVILEIAQKEKMETKKLSSKDEEKSIAKVSEVIEQNRTIVNQKKSIKERDTKLNQLLNELSVVTDDSLKRDDSNRDNSEMRIVIVQKGDTLAKIAYRVYGKKADYIKILEANSEFIKNPRQISIGQKLRIPE